ncbi:MAG: GNAT family N-acetyltransferase [Pseudomonadota bacterium]
MVISVRWDALERGEWDGVVAEAAPGRRAALQQDWSYGEAVRAIGGESLRAELRWRGAPVAVAQFTARCWRLAGRTLAQAALCARGPVWLGAPDEATKAECYRALRRTAPLGWPSLLIFAPDEPAPGEALSAAGLRRVMTGGCAALLRLDGDDATLRAAMRGKWRNRLVAAERPGAADALTLAWRRPTSTRLDALLREEAAQRRARRYCGLPLSLSQALVALSDPAGAWLLEARRRGHVVAAMLFVRHGRAATYHIGWAAPEGRRLAAHNAMLWRAMRDLRDAGVVELDLGGIDTERAAGLARFKLGAGARAAPLCGSYV